MKNIITLIIAFQSIISFSQTTKNSTIAIEQFPIYKGCHKKPDKEKCFQKKIYSLFSKHFGNYKFSPNEFQPGIEKAFIKFTITQQGLLDSVYVKANHPIIKREILKTLKKIPKCTPGTYYNKPINVNYSLPLAIKVVPVTLTNSAATRKTPWSSASTRKY